MEHDGGLEVLRVAESPSGVLDPLNLRVDSFGHGVGDRELQVREDVVEVGLHGLGRLLDGLKATPPCPPVPTREETTRGRSVAVGPEIRKRLLDRKRTVFPGPTYDTIREERSTDVPVKRAARQLSARCLRGR